MSEQTTSSIVSALHRLERAGSEHSDSTAKLLTAAGVLSRTLADILPTNEELPRMYTVTAHGYDKPELIMASMSGPQGWPSFNRANALTFARDVADGLLDELATWLDKRAGTDAIAFAILERAAEAMRGPAS